mgnify:CR=1 FL=1
MKKALMMIIISCLLFMGCQATPETAAVVAKDSTEQAVLESATASDAPITPYEVPAHVSQRFTIVDGALDMVIDADVDMPDIDRFPVALVKADPFTQAQADVMREYFVKDGKLFTQDVMTKSDYDEMIIEARRGHEVDGEYVFDESSQEWLDELLAMREEAPDEDTPIEITDFSIDGEGLCGSVVRNGQASGSLQMNDNSIYFGSGRDFWYDGQDYYDGNDKKISMKTCDINMTEEEAVTAADRILQDVGATGMAVKEMNKAYISSKGRDIMDEPEYGGYRFIFMRTFGGMMPFTVEGYSLGQDDHFDTSPPIDMETLELVINEHGEVEMFVWSNPAEITGTMTEHVEILPFDEIMERLETFSKQQYAFVGDFAPSDLLSIKKINHIGLYLNYLPIKNNASEFMFAPCWVFTYKDLIDYTEEQKADLKAKGFFVMEEEMMGDEVIVFSAVDGASVSAYSAKQYEEIMKDREGMGMD